VEKTAERWPILVMFMMRFVGWSLTLDDVVLALRGATSLPPPCILIGECACQSKQTLLKIIINFSLDLLFVTPPLLPKMNELLSTT
jgi:hypothetical protein